MYISMLLDFTQNFFKNASLKLFSQILLLINIRQFLSFVCATILQTANRLTKMNGEEDGTEQSEFKKKIAKVLIYNCSLMYILCIVKF